MYHCLVAPLRSWSGPIVVMGLLLLALSGCDGGAGCCDERDTSAFSDTGVAVADGVASDVYVVRWDSYQPAFCPPFILEPDWCNSAFGCDDVYNRVGCWASEFSCCVCATADCGKPCHNEGECEGRCIECGHGVDCDSSSGAPGYCGPLPQPYDLAGCFHYLDSAGHSDSFCTDPE